MSKPRSYDGELISVRYDVQRCIHAAECVKGLPSVFDSNARPWVNADGASAEDIARTIEACPSGALTYTRVDGKAEKPWPASIRASRNGPLYVTGDFPLLAPDGSTVSVAPRAALCRCGQSNNKPFCDGSHVEAGFTDR